MGFDREVDLSGIDPEELDAGTVNVPGWYPCEVVNVQEDSKTEGCLIFQFKVLDGEYKGGVVYDRLYDPAMAEDVDKAASATKRMSLYGIRLGLLKKEDFGKVATIPWDEAVEKRCWIHIEKQSWKDRKTGEDKSKIGVAWGGIYAIDDPRALKKAGTQGGEQPPPSANGRAPSKPKPPGKPPTKPATRPTISHDDL